MGGSTLGFLLEWGHTYTDISTSCRFYPALEYGIEWALLVVCHSRLQRVAGIPALDSCDPHQNTWSYPASITRTAPYLCDSTTELERDSRHARVLELDLQVGRNP